MARPPGIKEVSAMQSCLTCKRVVDTHGALNRHLKRAHQMMPTAKFCVRCSLIRPIHLFDTGSKDSKGFPAYRTICSDCRSDTNRERKAKRASRPQSHKDRDTRKAAREKFGLTLEQYEFAIEAGLLQHDMACPICHQKFSDLDETPHLDHDHATGKLRGVLCRRCNLALGYLRDSPKIARSAAEYLENLTNYSDFDTMVRESKTPILFIDGEPDDS